MTTTNVAGKEIIRVKIWEGKRDAQRFETTLERACTEIHKDHIEAFNNGMSIAINDGWWIQRID